MEDLRSLRERCLDAVLNDPSVGAGNFLHKLDAAVPAGEQPTAVTLLGDTVTGDRAMTLRDIVARADRLAAAYIKEGIEERDVVSVYLGDDFDYFLHFVALTAIGAIPNPINGGLAPETVKKFVANVRSRMLVVASDLEAEMVQRFEDLATRVVAIDRLKDHTDLPPCRKRFAHQPDDVVMLGHTSGTTGLPKAAIFTHESMFHGVRAQVASQKGETVLSALPHSHGAAMTLLMLCLSRGSRVATASRKEPEALLDTIERVSPDVVIAFPKTLADLCRTDLSQWDLGSVMYWIATGDANHEPHIRALIATGHHVVDGERRQGSRFVDNLGSSEIAFAAFRNVHGPGPERYARCIGKPFAWVEPAVFDEAGKRVGVGEIGRLGIVSKSITKGYWNDHSRSEKNRIDGYWLTGDLVFFDEDGFYYHVDRDTDAIRTKQGTLYSCAAEEWLLSRMPEVFEVSVVARGGPDDEWIVALVELCENVAHLSPNMLLDRINALMDEQGFLRVDAVEMQSAHRNVGATGKKLKRVLRARHEPLSA